LQELEECLPDENSIEKQLSSAEIAKYIDSFLESQAKENRVIFIRRYYFSDSITDIAERVAMSENNVSVRLSRMRKTLRNHLEKEGIEI
jgi:RNA polymerase sigma-70 factor (ECF subfamily)